MFGRFFRLIRCLYLSSVDSILSNTDYIIGNLSIGSYDERQLFGAFVIFRFGSGPGVVLPDENFLPEQLDDGALQSTAVGQLRLFVDTAKHHN